MLNYKCHPDDPNHVAVTCVQPCRRLCARGHPCKKQCAVPCGECQFPINDVDLPCGHRKATVSWCVVRSSIEIVYSCRPRSHLVDSLSEVFCDEVVTKALPNCEHTAQMMCSRDATLYRCEASCGGIMTSCCGRDCRSRCSECQQVNNKVDEGPVLRQLHRQHPCQKTLYCEHLCANPCSADHKCTTRCKEACRQVCSHARCRQHCSTPCAPCKERCTWSVKIHRIVCRKSCAHSIHFRNCSHFTCPVPCGSVSSTGCYYGASILTRLYNRCALACLVTNAVTNY